MSTNGETADLMVREGIQITESALKLAGLGAKNLAALLIALANDNQKLAGKTNLKRLIHDGEELTIFSVKQEDLKGFQMEAKRYGVLFYPIVNKVEKTGTVEIMAKARDAKQINRIFERMGYPAPVKEDTAAKKENARAPSENSSKERGTGARASTEPAAEKADARPSVRSRLMALQAAAERDGTAPTKDTVREAIQKAIGLNIIVQNIQQIKALYEKEWESIIGNCDTLLFLGGGNEPTSLEFIVKLLGKETIATRTRGQTKGRSGSSSTNFQQTGRDLMTIDEVRKLDTHKAILFIRGEDPVLDKKYNIKRHPNIKLTTDGKAKPYIHKPLGAPDYALPDLPYAFKSLDDYDFIDVEEPEHELSEKEKDFKPDKTE